MSQMLPNLYTEELRVRTMARGLAREADRPETLRAERRPERRVLRAWPGYVYLFARLRHRTP
jgi:hypothetical protein